MNLPLRAPYKPLDAPSLKAHLPRSQSVLTTRPNFVATPAALNTTPEWSTELFDCCDFLVPNGFMACCCPWITLAQVATRMGLMRYGLALLLFFVLVGPKHVGGLVLVVDRAASMEWGQFELIQLFKNDERLKCMDLVWLGGFMAVSMLQTLLTTSLRLKIRRRFAIPGEWYWDACASCCCTCCVAAQMATQVQSYKPGSCSFTAPDHLPAFEA